MLNSIFSWTSLLKAATYAPLKSQPPKPGPPINFFKLFHKGMPIFLTTYPITPHCLMEVRSPKNSEVQSLLWKEIAFILKHLQNLNNFLPAGIWGTHMQIHSKDVRPENVRLNIKLLWPYTRSQCIPSIFLQTFPKRDLQPDIHKGDRHWGMGNAWSS